MKLKLTVQFKNGSKVKMIKRLSDPPKGTDTETHYMLESCQIAESIQQNGLCLSISPAQIENIFIQPRKEGKDGPSRIAYASGPNM